MLKVLTMYFATFFWNNIVTKIGTVVRNTITKSIFLQKSSFFYVIISISFWIRTKKSWTDDISILALTYFDFIAQSQQIFIRFFPCIVFGVCSLCSFSNHSICKQKLPNGKSVSAEFFGKVWVHFFQYLAANATPHLLRSYT